MKKIILINTLLLISTFLYAAPPADYKYNPNPQKKAGDGLNKTAAGCVQTTATIDLDINNVRARLMNGGDMWWDRSLGAARYEVPKGSKKNSLFAGSLWLGGYEEGSGELKVAAQLFRNGGNDYYSGPLDIANGQSIDFQTCNDWDRFWKLNRADVTAFRNITAALTKPLDENSPEYAAYLVAVKAAIAAAPSSLIAKDLKEWPGKAASEATTASGGPLFVYNRDMAPFVDLNKDGTYNWRDGDYPDILGDQYIWWIFNDKGDLKTQTQSQSINLEVHTGGFAFATNDCLNESTFFNYKVHNWGSNKLDSCYMATFTDADLGNFADDFIGCDTQKGLGILYNADAYDESSTGYGYDLPNVAVDFFRGPRVRNDSGKLVELKMSNFQYFTGGASPKVNDPQIGQDFYNYMTGSWKDGTRISEGCNPEGPGIPANSVFIGDPCKEGLPTEVGCSNRSPGDRRFVHSAGPFKLLPGAVPSDVTIGAIWTPNVGGGKSSCFTKIILCDLKAQKLFDDQFILPFGPQAPTTSYLPLDKKLVFELSNPSSSNNYLEQYGFNLTDPFPSKYRERGTKLETCGPDPLTDSLYQFEGYVVYQLKDGTVTPSDIRSKDGSVNNEKARIVFQCDRKNDVTSIVNYEKDADISETYFVPKLMIRGENKGIRHNFQLTEDAFAPGVNKALINYKTYYYIAIAYAYNKFCNKDFTEQLTTQDIQYLESRTDGRELPIKVIAAIPHPANDNIYSQNYTEYGSGIQLKRIEGLGNGANAMQLTAATESNILKNGFEPFPEYEPNAGPVDVFVVKPDSLKAGDYEIYIKPLTTDPVYPNTREEGRGLKADSANWYIKNVTTGEIILSEINNIREYNDQYLRKYNAAGKLVLDWGLNASVKQVVRPGDDTDEDNNGLITSSVLFADVNNPWLSGIRDNEEVSFSNWIRAGSKIFEAGDLGPVNGCGMSDFTSPQGDTFNNYETIANGTWAPFNLVAFNIENKCGFGLMPNTTDRNAAASANRLQNIHSVDVVFTSDKNLWTKCPVIEMTDNVGTNSIAQNGTFKFNIRNHPSWNKQVDGQGKPIYDASEKGMSWFPGYAIDLETGDRLNLLFGEESYNAADNATDMLWNPTSVTYDPVSFKLKWGGKHVIYVLSTRYDQGAASKADLDAANNTSSPSDAALRNVFKNAMWVGNTLLSPFSKLLSPAEGLIPNYTKVSIRVARPYDKYIPSPGQTLKNNGWPLYSFSTKGMLPVKLNETGNNYTKNIDSLLMRIQPVPNPYYAYSEYEKDRLDTKVRIINLPEKATIKIFTVDGSLVKTIRKNDKLTAFIDWDLKNEKGILIGSGMYLMHVELDGIGETVLKWFGAMRPVDITQF